MFFSCLGIAWSIWDGVRLCFNNVSATLFFLNALPVPMLRQVYFQWFFRCVFSGRFWKGLFLVFFWFREVLRVPREVILDTFLEKIKFFCEKLEPSFFTPLKRFGLISRVQGLPERVKREKNSFGKLTFF